MEAVLVKAAHAAAAGKAPAAVSLAVTSARVLLTSNSDPTLAMAVETILRAFIGRIATVAQTSFDSEFGL